MLKSMLLPSAFLLLFAFYAGAAPPGPQFTLIQGRITALQGSLISVKTPDAYPRGPGRRSLYVAAGPTFRVNIATARFLLADGQRTDPKPLAVGERVIVLLSMPYIQPPVTPRTPPSIYAATVIERQAVADSITGP